MSVVWLAWARVAVVVVGSGGMVASVVVRTRGKVRRWREAPRVDGRVWLRSAREPIGCAEARLLVYGER